MNKYIKIRRNALTMLRCKPMLFLSIGRWSRLLIMSLLLSTMSHAGSTSSGGGTSVALPDSPYPVLLDLYLKNGSPINSSAGEPLLETRAFKKLGIERLRNSGHPAIGQAKKLLKRWNGNSKGLVDLILNELEAAPFYYVKYRFGFRDRNYYIPQDQFIPESKLNLVAFYSDQLGVLFSKPEFDQIESTSQVAVLIHEALRHLQNRFGWDFSTRVLQELTATLVFTQPQTNDILEDMVELDGSLSKTFNPPVDPLTEWLKKVPVWMDQYGALVPKETLDNVASAFANRHSSRDSMRHLRRTLVEFSNALSDYRNAHWAQLGHAGRSEIDDVSWEILNLVESMITASVGGALHDMEKSVEGLKNVTRKVYLQAVEDLIDEANGTLAGRRSSASARKLRSAFRELEKTGLLR